MLKDKMGESRTKNTTRNIVFGVANKIVVLVLPFITRTLLLYLLGTGSLGLSTLFASVLSFLSLAELGFGQAVIYSMYKPIAENNVYAICSLLKYYRKLYRIIGCIILLIGLALMPVLPYLIHGDIPVGVNIYWLYLIYLTNSTISYFFAGYRQSLLTAHQRADIRDKIALVVTICVRLLEILTIWISKDLYAYASVAIIGTIITNIITAVVTRRMYPEIECSGNISNEQRYEIKTKLTGLFGTKLNSIVVHQADTLVISSFLGLTLLAQYGNYYYILNAVSGFIMIIFNSMTASIGNKIALDSREEVYRLFERISFINYWLVSLCSICLMCIFQPFMILWVKAELTLPIFMSFLMTIYFYIYQIQRTILVFKDAGGLWYEDRYRPYISMAFNLISNIVLVQFIGIYGIVISTIIAFTISVPWCNYVVFTKLFALSPWKNILRMLRDFVITAFIGTGTYFICCSFPVSVLGVILRLLVCIIIPNLIYFIIYHKSDSFIYYRDLFMKFFKRRLL